MKFYGNFSNLEKKRCTISLILDAAKLAMTSNSAVNPRENL